MSETFIFSCTKAKNELVLITKKRNVDIPTQETVREAGIEPGTAAWQPGIN
jgi:hypothetical protein